ncbi:sigma-54-dependent transcriptional regulator [Bacillaceae bacterium Marseille-Q3522]|nr:sigma-54-dependent transcriptional regulator [Bacillaceae bacterium Marseille-Q3522]
MQTVMIVGGGQGGLTILQILKESALLQVIAMVDRNPNAPGIGLAKKAGIQTGTDWRTFIDHKPDIIIEVTGEQQVYDEIKRNRKQDTILIPSSVASILVKLIQDKEKLIGKLKSQSYKNNLIVNAINDGMIVVNKEAEIIFINRSAARMIKINAEEANGRHIYQVIPQSKLPHILKTEKMEANQELIFDNGLKVITTRIPILDEDGQLLGAFAVFKNITEIVNLAEEVTNLKEIQTMLQAIIQSSDEAISVVDENGKGLLINRAYTRLTGLTEKDVIGKPATVDISEGDSVHMKVLQTKKAVRGATMRVGPQKKDVVVNIAPVIVDGKLKGSVGVIHDVSEIQMLNRELLKAKQIIRTLEAKYTFADIIGFSEEMILALEQAKVGAKTPATVLLRGESGTGKELFAHAIHNASDRRYNKFIRVNCASLSESLLESELFGYEEGAFSGAKRGGKRGLFEEANNGSIFLDEIGELSANTQAKLLRVLQENEIIRVGGTKSITINVRVIAATNVNLEKQIISGAFREDLYYRLNRIPIHIPPLRKRREDIPYLCGRLIQKINQEYGRTVETISERAIAKLIQYDWPGNVRELENILGRTIIFMHHLEKQIDVEHLPELTMKRMKEAPEIHADAVEAPQTLAESMAQYEKKLIKKALNISKGNKTKAAQKLGLSIRNLYYKLDKYNLAETDMQNFADHEKNCVSSKIE